MKNESMLFLKAYIQRRLGNLNGPYRVYELLVDENNSKGVVMIWNVNSLDYQIITTELNSIDLLQEDIPDFLLNILYESVKKR